MTLGDYISNNSIEAISVSVGLEGIDERVRFEDIDMIPMKYWNAEIRTLRHKIDYTGVEPVEMIAIVRL